jgi:glutaredoxin 2
MKANYNMYYYYVSELYIQSHCPIAVQVLLVSALSNKRIIEQLIS